MRKILLSLLLTTPFAFAQDGDAPAQTTLDLDATAFVLEGQDYDLTYLLQFTALLVPDPESLDLQQAYPFLTELAIEQELAAQKAIELGIGQDEQTQNELALIVNSILANLYLEQQVNDQLTPARIEEAYSTYALNFVGEEQATARHILVDSEEEGLSAISRLDAGEDFAALAQELSTGPSGPNGGDLGTFPRGVMVTEFEVAVFDLTPGAYSSAPIETQFGWHVIKLEDLATTEPAPLADIRDDLVQGLSNQIQTEVRAQLREGVDYSVETFDSLQLSTPAN